MSNEGFRLSLDGVYGRTGEMLFQTTDADILSLSLYN